MKNRLVSMLVAFFLPVAVFGAGATDGSTPATLTGTYVLVEHLKGVEAPDRIEFHADGSCVLDIDGQNGVAGTYHTNSEGNLAIEPGAGNPMLTYVFNREKMTLILSHENQSDLYYGLVPARPPHLQFSDFIGIVSCHNESGDSASEITADHKFHDHLHELSVPSGGVTSLLPNTEDRVYYDVYIDGTCSYANGVITYMVEHCKAPQQDQSLADVVIKRDDQGLWVIDVYHDKVIFQPVAKNLDLPPPPAGYEEATP